LSLDLTRSIKTLPASGYVSKVCDLDDNLVHQCQHLLVAEREESGPLPSLSTYSKTHYQEKTTNHGFMPQRIDMGRLLKGQHFAVLLPTCTSSRKGRACYDMTVHEELGTGQG
jgi:hypothetical protein